MFLAVFLGAWPAGDEAAGRPDDMALIRAAQRGSADAFAALHARYYQRIYRLAYLKTNNSSDAEDIASETFLRALAALPRYKTETCRTGASHSFYPWLHRIAVNLVVDSARQRPASPVLSLDAPIIQGMRDLLADRLDTEPAAGSPQEIVERHEVQQLVRDAIACLPADQGEILIYRFLGELSIREIAELMGRSEPAAKSLLHRAVVAIRKDLRRQLDEIENEGRLSRRQKTGNQEALQHVGASTH